MFSKRKFDFLKNFCYNKYIIFKKWIVVLDETVISFRYVGPDR